MRGLDNDKAGRRPTMNSCVMFFINNTDNIAHIKTFHSSLSSYTCTAECIWQSELTFHCVVWLTSSQSVQPDVTHHISVHVLDFPLFLRVSLQVNQVWTYFPTHNLWIVKGLQTACLCGEKSSVIGVECSAPSGLWGRSSETDRNQQEEHISGVTVFKA